MNIGIVGAGIMGCTLALKLANARYKVSLFDKAKRGTTSCSYVAAGLLTPISELEKSPYLIYQLGKEAIQEHWPMILTQLNHIYSEIYFQNKGSIAIAHPQDQADLLRFLTFITTKFPKKNLSQFYQQLNQDELLQLEPELQRFHRAYYFKDEAQVDNQTLLTHLKNYLSEKCILHTDAHVMHLSPHEVTVHGEKKAFTWVIDCRGLEAKSEFTDLHGIRGELIWLHAPNVSITRPIRFMHPRYSLYIVPRPNHVYIIGASEIHTENNDAISVRTTLELLSAAYALHPGFAEARIIKTATQCRPTLKNYLPRIQYKKGMLAINGLYRHGFLIAPTLAHHVLQALQNDFTHLPYLELWKSYAN